MSYRALLFSADTNAIRIVSQVLAEMGIAPEECGDISFAQQRIRTHQYEVIVVDCPEPSVSCDLLRAARLSTMNRVSLLISLVDAQSSVRSAFASGANFVLYRPLSEERVRSSLKAAQHLLRREKRRHPRTAVHSQASISYPQVESASATLVDLSEEGLALQCERQIPAKSKIYFRFTLPGQVRCIQLSGETMWTDSTGRAGIRFADVPQTGRRLIKEWLSSKSSMQESKVTVQLPVGQPGRLHDSPPDRRIQSRHACQLGVDVYRVGTDVPHRCSLSDISVGGCYVEISSPLPVGTRVDMIVRTQRFKFQSRGVVQVVHPGFGMGVAFAAQTDEQREQVQQLIKLVFQNRAADSDPVLKF